MKVKHNLLHEINKHHLGHQKFFPWCKKLRFIFFGKTGDIQFSHDIASGFGGLDCGLIFVFHKYNIIASFQQTFTFQKL